MKLLRGCHVLLLVPLLAGCAALGVRSGDNVQVTVHSNFDDDMDISYDVLYDDGTVDLPHSYDQRESQVINAFVPKAVDMDPASDVEVRYHDKTRTYPQTRSHDVFVNIADFLSGNG